jgi:secreted trypsin-like serine protease
VRKNDGTPYGAAPWHAIVYSNKNKDLICAGAIVSENAVLTTAHCLDHSEAETTEVKIGPEGKVFKVAAIARHSKYDPVSFSRDLALVVLKEPIEFNEYVEKICLPTSFTQLHSYNRDCYVSTLAKEFEPNTLQTIPVQVFTYKDCEVKLRNTYLGKYFVLNDSFSCVSTPAEAELCLVKTGSPIACDKGDGTFELFGIKSWDLGCQEYKKSAVFANFDVIWVQTTLASPITKLIAEEKARQKDKFKGDTLEGINIQDKPGFALGYGK